MPADAIIKRNTNVSVIVNKLNGDTINAARTKIKVVRPKAKPSLPGRFFAIAANVIGIVNSKRNIPIIEAKNRFVVNEISGAETN